MQARATKKLTDEEVNALSDRFSREVVEDLGKQGDIRFERKSSQCPTLMKALLDSNIFISYLLPRRETEQSQTIRSIVEGGIEGRYTIVLLVRCANKVGAGAEKLAPWWTMAQKLDISGTTRKTRSELMRERNADPEFRAAQAAGVKRRFADPKVAAEHAKMASERLVRLNADPEFKAAQSERLRRQMMDPEFRELRRQARARAARSS
jgi:hypothetical protein